MKPEEKKNHRDGLVFLLLGAVALLLIGFAWKHLSPIEMGDFKVVYYSARTLLQHGDPYSQHDVLAVYNAEGRENPAESVLDRDVKTRYFYPPTAFILTVPIALTGFAVGKIVWMILCAGSLILASLLIWNISVEFAPTAAGVLPGLLLAGSFWLFMVGNSAAIAVSLCVIATWCFYRARFAWAGVLCLALSLSLKPNDSGLVWLFFLLAAPSLRKRALQSLAILVVLSAPFVLWAYSVSPHWTQELQANMAPFSAPGSIVDPGITGMAGKNMDCIVPLQTALSVFFPQPVTYNLLTYAICLPLVLIWAVITLRNRPSGKRIWLGLAAAAPLSMLPTYHFQHDAKLLLLTIPACVMLWSGREALGRWALVVTLAGILVNGDIFTAIRIMLTRQIIVPQPNFASRLATVFLTRPAPLALLLVAVFYLWIYWRHREIPSSQPVPQQVTVTNASGI
ncbi:MAG TPA: glycosyltransferase family 87 protein [Terracidiphilus sp.]|jgi:hypothetical protein